MVTVVSDSATICEVVTVILSGYQILYHRRKQTGRRSLNKEVFEVRDHIQDIMFIFNTL